LLQRGPGKTCFASHMDKLKKCTTNSMSVSAVISDRQVLSARLVPRLETTCMPSRSTLWELIRPGGRGEGDLYAQSPTPVAGAGTRDKEAEPKQPSAKARPRSWTIERRWDLNHLCRVGHQGFWQRVDDHWRLRTRRHAGMSPGGSGRPQPIGKCSLTYGT